MTGFAAIILAAGKGTRMKSSLPKVLHPIVHRPMLGHVMAALGDASATHLYLVTAPHQDEVRRFADGEEVTLTHCLQETQLGTGDAVKAALPHCGAHDRLVIMFGDTPLMRSEVLHELANAPSDLAVLGFEPDNAAAYGRVIVGDDGPQEIVEFKDADAATRQITLCNGGAMAISLKALQTCLPLLQNDNAQGEYYLPDLVRLARENGFSRSLVMAMAEDTMGVDSRAGQAIAEGRMQKRLRARHLANGVTMQDPDSVFLSHDTIIGENVTLEPNVQINPGVTIGAGSLIRAFSHLEGAQIGENCQIGPYARLRPGTIVGAAARIGNFVETKKALLGEGAKVNHLSYIGDAELGAAVNVGAGTITCNYDGFNKHLTKIGDGAFIGSNSSLIAPVEIGAGAYLGSGSAVSKPVPENSLVVTRAPVREIAGWAEKFRDKNRKSKD